MCCQSQQTSRRSKIRTSLSSYFFFFFFNDTATTEIYTLSLHDALPISSGSPWCSWRPRARCKAASDPRSEEHTSELQSQSNLVCRLLLEKKHRLSPPPPLPLHLVRRRSHVPIPRRGHVPGRRLLRVLLG